MTNNEKMKALLDDLGLSYKDVAKIIGNTYESVKTSYRPGGELPRQCLLTIYVWEKLRKS